MVDESTVKEFTRRHLQTSTVDLTVTSLQGGLEATGISRVTATNGNGRAVDLVVKPLAGEALRELEVLRSIQLDDEVSISPRLLEWLPTGSSEGYMVLEWVEAVDSWPWSDSGNTALVLRQLARVHEIAAPHALKAAELWDYETDLRQSAEETLGSYRTFCLGKSRPGRRPLLRAIQRLTENLERIREELIGYTGFGLIHGDAHPGNAVITSAEDGQRAVLLDWGRARLGSPLEDVSNWLQSLAFWEPQARRDHDTLLNIYLSARHMSEGLTRSYRRAYWLAAACNALSGALRYHIAVAMDPQRPESERFQSWHAAGDWLRIIRRADTLLRA